MSPQLALFACALFILWLFYQDKRRCSGVSPALWIAVAWVAIVASRPVSAWLDMEGGSYAGDAETEGNSVDRNVFLLLIIAALFVLQRRNINWRVLIANNSWLFLLYLFFGISILWSDYPFIALKRWFKDLGNILVVLIILTEKDLIEAVRTVFARCAYLIIPLSVLFIKYFPQLGRTFSRFTGANRYQGVTLNKNQLGAAVMVLTLFLISDLLRILRKQAKPTRKIDILILLILLGMAAWLLRIANSATSVACTVFGSFALVAVGTEFVRNRLRHFFAWSIVAAVFLFVASQVVDLKGDIADMLGRDPTLTGRDQIWKSVLAEHTNPLIGTGFSSFWLGNRPERVSEKNGFPYRLNQAHNGYLEVYLNGGAIGACLLVALLITSGRCIKRQLFVDTDWAALKLTFWVIVIIYNWSEAAFLGIGTMWFVLLLVIIEIPRTSKVFVFDTGRVQRELPDRARSRTLPSISSIP
jgi:exopolysaccharide production protein ExoQ